MYERRKKNMKTKSLSFRNPSVILLIVMILSTGMLSAQAYKELHPPKENGIWIQPSEEGPAQPVWGFANGIQIGLAPMPGPRGLLRIYTPYLGHKDGTMINFIAVEPIPKGSVFRGLSELEMSSLDSVRGKRMWSSDTPTAVTSRDERYPAKGVITKENGFESLSFYVFVEPFDNGTKVFLRVRFYENKPYEVELSTFVYEGAPEPEYCILTATMGNYARLRNLYLGKEVINSGVIWPDYRESAFTEHESFAVSRMIRDREKRPYFIAAPDEKHPQKADYDASTVNHWKYYGKKATQYWYVPGDESGLEGLVNGRYAYWASTSPIPGGIAYENFELKQGFRNGQTFVFGVTPLNPKKFIHYLQK